MSFGKGAPLVLSGGRNLGKIVMLSLDLRAVRLANPKGVTISARYPITFFSGIHPGDAISLGDDEKLVQAARDTVEAINGVNWWSPTNGLCMAWPPASRVSNDAAATLANFDAALNSTLQPNLWPRIENRPTGGWGCPAEQAGATLAINDLLVQSQEGERHSEPESLSQQAL